MPKKLLSLIIGLALFIPVFVQLTSVRVEANHDPSMTSPITFFNLIGRVTYRHLGRLTAGMQRVMGADDIVVTLTAFFNPSVHYTTTTDPNGVYSFNVPAGLYKVMISDPSNTADMLVPPLRVENLNTHQAKHADFQGLLLPK